MMLSSYYSMISQLKLALSVYYIQYCCANEKNVNGFWSLV
jgi:hypothetical protein